MRVIVEAIAKGEEEQIIVRCHRLSPRLMRIIDGIEEKAFTLIAYEGKKIFHIDSPEVYYIEAVDSKVFLYLEKKVYESKQKLYELESELETDGFLRVSKSTILNLRKAQSFTPALAGRFEASLQNGEKILISRKYVPSLKRTLGM